MTSYRLTRRALQDIDQITDFTLTKWGDRQAEKYLSDLSKRFDWLAKNPGAGRLRDDVGAGYRSYRQGSHLIFYLMDGDVLAVIGIPHGSMDIDAYFQSPA